MTPTPASATRANKLSRSVFIRSSVSNALLSVWFAIFAYNFIRGFLQSGNVQLLLLALQQTLVVVLVVTRRNPKEESRSFIDWALGIGGTAAPMLFQQVNDGVAIHALPTIIQLIGLLFATFALSNLGRSFGIVAANRGVRTAGLYRYVRHPVYGSYIFGEVGFVLGSFSIWNVVVLAVVFTCHFLRARAEEKVLLRDPEYKAYAEKVRYRFFPFIV